MVFSWLQRRRRAKLLATPFPPEWLIYLRKNVAHYQHLSEREQARLRDDLRIFVSEKHWEGSGGLKITEEIKVTIAAQACLLVLGVRHNYFDRVSSILVYPRGYSAPAGDDTWDGPIHGERSARLMDDPDIREPDQIRRDCARKLRAVQVSEHFQAILGRFLGEDWTTPRLVEMVITPDGHMLGRCEGQASFSAFLGASEELLKNIHGLAAVAKLDGDEMGYLLGKVAEIKRRK